jgi:cell division protein FtsQ
MTDPENALLRDEMEEESPYRRRQKAVAVSRRRLPRARRWLKALVVALVVIPALAYSGFRLWEFVRSSASFRLNPATDIVVNGNHFVSQGEIVAALLGSGRRSEKAALGPNVFSLSLEDAAKQVESLSWVRSATLVRTYPHRLVVNIVERTPVAFANVGGHLKLVDAEGVLLDKPEKAHFDFPVLSGFDSLGAADRKARMALEQDFVGQVAGELPRSGWIVSEIGLADGDDLKAVLVQGQDTVLVHFGHQDFAQRFHTFLALLPQLRAASPKINSVDLRYRNEVVVNPEPAAAGDK